MRPDGMDQADLLQEQRDLEHVGHALAHRDDALGNHVVAELRMRFGGGVEHLELAHGLVAVFDEIRGQRPRVAQFVCQQRHPRFFVERQIRHAGLRGIEQFGHGSLVHGRVLADVEAGEMEAEAIDRAPQQSQPAACDHARIVRDQRAVEHVEIGLQFRNAAIGRALADRPSRDLDIELFAVADSRA